MICYEWYNMVWYDMIYDMISKLNVLGFTSLKHIQFSWKMY